MYSADYFDLPVGEIAQFAVESGADERHLLADAQILLIIALRLYLGKSLFGSSVELEFEYVYSARRLHHRINTSAICPALGESARTDQDEYGVEERLVILLTLNRNIRRNIGEKAGKRVKHVVHIVMAQRLHHLGQER